MGTGVLSPATEVAGGLLFNSGQYNRSVLISAIRVRTRGYGFGLRLALTCELLPRAHAWSRGGHGFGPTIGRAKRSCKVRPDSIGVSRRDGAAALSTSPPKSRVARSDTSGFLLSNINHHIRNGVLQEIANWPPSAAPIASLRPDEATRMWEWLIQYEYFSPLNNVESLMFPAGAACDSGGAVWNQLKGSWNLSLQTLGWGRYLAERRGQVPVLWQAAMANAFLREGYLLLAPGEPNSG